MVIALTGTNSYALKKRLDEIVGDFVRQYGDLAVERLDGAEADLERVIEAAQSLPFLASAKLVILREVSSSRQLADSIEQIIDSTNESTTLIITEQLPDKRTSFYKTLKSKSQFEEFNQLEPGQLTEWLVDQAKQAGYQLASAEAAYLVDRVGANQAVLASELEKLGLYELKITKENIDLLTEKSLQSKIFDLLDAAFSGSKKKALSLYDEQRAQQVEPQNILALVTWQLNILVLAKLGGARPAGEIAKHAGLSSYPVQKAQHLVSRITEDKLKEMVNQAMMIDYKSKQSAIDLNEALKTFLVSL